MGGLLSLLLWLICRDVASVVILIIHIHIYIIIYRFINWSNRFLQQRLQLRERISILWQFSPTSTLHNLFVDIFRTGRRFGQSHLFFHYLAYYLIVVGNPMERTQSKLKYLYQVVVVVVSKEIVRIERLLRRFEGWLSWLPPTWRFQSYIHLI